MKTVFFFLLALAASCLAQNTITYKDGQTQIFNPNATRAGINVGSLSGDPSSLNNGDIWYDSGTGKFRKREGGTSSDLGGGGGVDGIYTDIASNTSVAIGATATVRANITGTTTITTFTGGTAGTYREGKFEGALTWTHNSTSMILPTAQNILTAAGDTFGAVTNDATNWRVVWYLRADGTPLALNALYGSDGTTRLNVFYAAQATGTAYSLTNTAAGLNFGTTDTPITIVAGGVYRINAQVQLTYTGATVAAETATIKVRRTNNTAADVSSVVVIDLPVATTLTHTYGTVSIPPFYYTATAGDILEIYGNVSATLGAGTIDATAVGTSIDAIRVYE